MAAYRICPYCGAALDPGEICADCRNEAQETKKTAPDAANIESGKVEIGLATNISAFILTKE